MEIIVKEAILLANSFSSNIHLHAYIFLAQELGLIPSEYVFDYSFNIPFSEKLEYEFMLLKSDGIIREVDNGKKIIVNNQQPYQILNLTSQQVEKLRIIAALEEATLVNLSRLLFLIKKYPELSAKENSDMLQEKARRSFFMNMGAFKDTSARLQILKEKVILK